MRTRPYEIHRIVVWKPIDQEPVIADVAFSTIRVTSSLIGIATYERMIQVFGIDGLTTLNLPHHVLQQRHVALDV